MKHKVALYPSDEGVAVCALSLLGCWSQGETVEEALVNIADAIREYREVHSESVAVHLLMTTPADLVCPGRIDP